ncbi:MAG: adenylate/guanylate cyclase domain-containing protein [Acidobacteria bacterium]|nr:adenylate/guanylate cyclase domain-containing protein [Acidobacteriota bacterium]
MLLRLHGPYADAEGQRTYPAYSFVDLLRSEDLMLNGAAPLVDPAEFRGKYVFIGTTAPGLKDTYPSPFGGPAMPGVQLHAATVDDVLSQRFMRKADTTVDVLTTGGVSLAAGVVAVVLPVGWAVGVVLVLGAILVWATTAAIGAGVWVSLVPPVLGLSLATFGGTAWQYFVEDRQKRLMKQLFGRYVSPDVFAHLVADPSLARLGGQRREMTVLFSDIRGFTTASEKATPEAVVAQLNEYFSAMVAVLFRHQGTLDKFVGDMVMGLFGAPVTDPHHADHAVAAALEMVQELNRLNADWKARGMPTVDIGIGINSGDMIAGNIGSDTVMSYTVIGDSVNLGSRLESATKEHGVRILISEAVRSRLTTDVPTREIGAITVKGKAQAIVVHEVIGGRS